VGKLERQFVGAMMIVVGCFTLIGRYFDQLAFSLEAAAATIVGLALAYVVRRRYAAKPTAGAR
jgi:hypothetical protein